MALWYIIQTQTLVDRPNLNVVIAWVSLVLHYGYWHGSDLDLLGRT